MEKLLLIGAGGYAKSVIDAVDYFNYKIEGFIDEFSTEESHLGFPIVANSLESVEDAHKYVYFVCIGNNERRKIWYERLCRLNLRMINVVDHSAIVSSHAVVGNGNFIGKMAVINSGSIIGSNCIINTKSLVEHGCTLGDHVNLSTNAVVNGDVVVGDGSFIGSSSVTVGQIVIGKWAVVGAGTVVIRNVGDGETVVGVPARVIKKEECL